MAVKKPAPARLIYAGLPYLRQANDRKETRRGMVSLFDEAGEIVVRELLGTPQIPRICRLTEGVRKAFGRKEFFAEEKLDGYNTRLFRHQGRLLAATRSGYICPFTSEWATIWAESCDLTGFFAAHPEHVLLGEVVGDNPYNYQRDPTLAPGAHLQIYEIIGPQGLLPPEERYRLLERFALPGVPTLGRHSLKQLALLRETMLELERRGREGVVLKALDGTRSVKYVTPGSDLQDLRDQLLHGYDINGDYFINRLLRAALFVQDQGLDQAAYAARVGRAVLDGASPLQQFEQAAERFEIYVAQMGTWDELAAQLNEQTPVETDEIEPVPIDGRLLLKVRFHRVYKKSTARLRRIVRGQLIKD